MNRFTPSRLRSDTRTTAPCIPVFNPAVFSTTRMYFLRRAARPATAVMALCLATGAYAQTSVTLSGTVDGGVRYLTNGNTTGGNVVTMNSNGYYSSNKIDFGGREDLGGGLNAHFLLENGFNLSNGAYDNTTGIEFNRQAFVGLGSKNWGSIDLGRQYTIAHDIISYYDPFHFHYTPLIPLTTAADGTRFNNDVKYKGTFGNLRVEADNSFGGVAGAFSSGAARGFGLTYAQGPVSVGGLIEHRNVLVGTSYQGDDYYMAGTNVKLGKFEVTGGYMAEDQANPTTSRTVTRNAFGGASFHFTEALALTGGYYQTNVSNDRAARRALSIVSLAYRLSRRTTVYAEGDYTRFKNSVVSTLNTSGKKSQVGATVGIDHMF